MSWLHTFNGLAGWSPLHDVILVLAIAGLALALGLFATWKAGDRR